MTSRRQRPVDGPQGCHYAADGSHRPDDIIAAIREHAADRTTAKMLDTRDSLFDVIVHSQDIARPLGREFAVPLDFTRRGLERVWQMGWPFSARRRLAGLTLRATDTDWTAGSGPEVAGDALSMLLLLTGRRDAVGHALHGAGAAEVLIRLAGWIVDATTYCSCPRTATMGSGQTR